MRLGFLVAAVVLAWDPRRLTVEGFQVVAVSASSRRRTLSTRVNAFSGPPSGGSVSSSLIAEIAVIALKLRLAAQTDVRCDVTSTTADLLTKGRVGPVSVRGRSWQSGLGLSCRAIDATVDICELDIGVVLAKQKLVLKTPAKGSAMVALNSQDFANFITHPLMSTPVFKNSSESAIQFLKEGAEVDPSAGAVTFLIRYAESKWVCKLKRGPADKRAVVEVAFDDTTNSPEHMDEVSIELTDVLSRFFNEMVFGLDGTFLSFRDMMITEKGDSPSVMLALSIVVKKFPSPGLAF